MSDTELAGMMGLASSALQVAGNITSSTFSYNKTKELARFQNDMNIENWKMQNEYNLPVNQMLRFNDAGLNPNLIYGQGTNGNSSAVPSPSLSNPNFKNPFAGVEFAKAFEETKALQLDNERKKLINHEEFVRAYEAEQRKNAIQLFIDDKLGVAEKQGMYVFPGMNFGSSTRSYEELRNTPTYQQLKQLWQRGVINQNNIANIAKRNEYLEKQIGAIDFQSKRGELLGNILTGGDYNFRDLIALLLIRLLESSSSSSVISNLFK